MRNLGLACVLGLMVLCSGLYDRFSAVTQLKSNDFSQFLNRLSLVMANLIDRPIDLLRRRLHCHTLDKA